MGDPVSSAALSTAINNFRRDGLPNVSSAAILSYGQVCLSRATAQLPTRPAACLQPALSQHLRHAMSVSSAPCFPCREAQPCAAAAPGKAFSVPSCWLHLLLQACLQANVQGDRSSDLAKCLPVFAGWMQA